MSFVSNSSTSGFKVPTNTIISHFADDNLIVDDLLEGGSDAFFSEVRTRVLHSICSPENRMSPLSVILSLRLM